MGRTCLGIGELKIFLRCVTEICERLLAPLAPPTSSLPVAETTALSDLKRRKFFNNILDGVPRTQTSRDTLLLSLLQ